MSAQGWCDEGPESALVRGRHRGPGCHGHLVCLHDVIDGADATTRPPWALTRPRSRPRWQLGAVFAWSAFGPFGGSTTPGLQQLCYGSGSYPCKLARYRSCGGAAIACNCAKGAAVMGGTEAPFDGGQLRPYSDLPHVAAELHSILHLQAAQLRCAVDCGIRPHARGSPTTAQRCTARVHGMARAVVSG
jgi:hypothetical protein